MFATALITALQKARHMVVFTGAGVSSESGIPTFRDAQTGLWEKFDASVLASPQGFRNDEALVWGWYEWRRMQVLKAQPNPAHYAIAELANHVEQLTVITQNVDDLHERAGSSPVIHLHGSLHEPRCFTCSRPYAFPDGIPNEPETGRRLMPPRCSYCDGSIRPGVVWFGESLPEASWWSASLVSKNCDVFLSIGTSSVVWPAAKLPMDAAHNGSMVIQVNPDVTNLDVAAHYNLHGKAGEILPKLISALRTNRPGNIA